ncbi:MAG: HAD family hydrolase [Chromatiaceae bacterium]|jgi:phosphoglycolate phosphatase|nr:HAD family hydrolase [Chromatiaceae bacterium]
MTNLRAPRIIIFDWHGTLADTNDAMYRAMDDMLGRLRQLGLDRRLADSAESRTDDDRKLVEFVRSHQRLHPKVVADRRASRTDLLEVLFSGDEEAKDKANLAYNNCYRHHVGDVKPFAHGVRCMLAELRALGVKLGILTNRSREFLDKELEAIERGTWIPFFDSTVTGSDTNYLKPSPIPVFRALRDFEAAPGTDVWYLGDSQSDTITAKTAGITSIFFNGARGDKKWIESVFPGTEAQPYRPDCVVTDYREFLELVKRVISRNTSSKEDDPGNGS